MPLRFSIITATYNVRSTVADALQSLAAQSHREFEHLIIDGASNDGTLDLLHSLSDERTRIVSEPDAGIYDALNKGLHAASGDVVGFLHADDLYADEHVLRDVAALFEGTGADAVYGDLAYVSKDDTQRVIRRWVTGDYRPGSLAFGWMPPHPALFVRRGLCESAGDFDTRYRIAADYDHILRVFMQLRSPPAYLKRQLVCMRVGGASNRSVRNVWLKTREDYHIACTHGIGGAWTVLCKNFRKLPQLIVRD